MQFLFIVNPNSGTVKKDKVIIHIKSFFSNDNFDILYWQTSDQDIKADIKKRLSQLDGISTVVAVGGDGTINTVAQTLINTPLNLGIIPAGSGNGLARHLGIPLDTKKAIQVLLTGKTITIDTCKVNDQAFLSTCGVGFDAEVSSHFSHASKRGFWSYARIAFSSYWKYKAADYKLIINEQIRYKKALLIAFANSNQFGNNAIIAPNADIQDGILDVIIVKPFPFYTILAIGIKLFNKTIHRSKYIEIIPVESVTLIRENPGLIQYDGEPKFMDKKLNIRVVPDSLRVMVASGGV